MKSKNILFSIGMILALVFAAALISAAVNVNYDVRYAVIQEDGTIDYQTTLVQNVDTVGYVCTSADCSTVGASLTGLARHTNTNLITLTYPTALQNPNGYGAWFYKQGYIHWEEASDWQGTGTAPDTYTVYLAKKETGYAPIMNLNVVNEVQPNRPVEVGVIVGIDADTYSAIENAGPLDYTPAELAALTNVETVVTLEIRNSLNAVIYTNTRTVNVPYSGSLPVAFTYSGFSAEGDYEIRVYTDVTDDKILNSERQTATADIEVIPAALVDYGYTILNGLEMSPALPDEDEQITFSFDFISNYVSPTDILTPVNTHVAVNIYRDGDRIDTDVYHNLGPGAGTYSFQKSFDDEGSYRIVLEGTPEGSSLLDGKRLVSSTQEITFVIGEEAQDDDDEDDDDEETEEKSHSGEPNVITPATTGTVDLTSEEKGMPLYKKILYSLGAGILILLVAIAIVSAVKFE